jgi:hypothetical protein
MFGIQLPDDKQWILPFLESPHLIEDYVLD